MNSWRRVVCLLSLLVGLSRVTSGQSMFYVATNGNDGSGNGSSGNPWATITHAVDTVPDGSTVLVRPGTYFGRVSLRRVFATGITVRSEVPYQARLRYDATVVTCDTPLAKAPGHRARIEVIE